MPRLIDADALNEKLQPLIERYLSKGRMHSAEDYRLVLAVLDCAPTINPDDFRLRGRWIVQDMGRTKFSCNRCKVRNYGGHENYCPNCGAKMDGKEQTDDNT